MRLLGVVCTEHSSFLPVFLSFVVGENQNLGFCLAVMLKQLLAQFWICVPTAPFLLLSVCLSWIRMEACWPAWIRPPLHGPATYSLSESRSDLELSRRNPATLLYGPAHSAPLMEPEQRQLLHGFPHCRWYLSVSLLHSLSSPKVTVRKLPSLEI